MSDQDLLDWQRLRDWTESKEPGYEVGISCTNNQCPLALYLLEQTGRAWSVGPSIRRDDGSQSLDKPTWVYELLYFVDLGNKMRRAPITREQFLAALEVVKPCKG